MSFGVCHFICFLEGAFHVSSANHICDRWFVLFVCKFNGVILPAECDVQRGLGNQQRCCYRQFIPVGAMGNISRVFGVASFSGLCVDCRWYGATQNSAHQFAVNLMIVPLAGCAVFLYGFASGWGNLAGGASPPGWSTAIGSDFGTLNHGLGRIGFRLRLQCVCVRNLGHKGFLSYGTEWL